jgi:hypothetical protein
MVFGISTITSRQPPQVRRQNRQCNSIETKQRSRLFGGNAVRRHQLKPVYFLAGALVAAIGTSSVTAALFVALGAVCNRFEDNTGSVEEAGF